MNLNELLKQFKYIEADREYTRKSRSLILSAKHTARVSLADIFLKNVQLAASVALAGLLIFMIVGGFSAWRMFSPLQIANLDPVGLKAEAQAIDIQIQLANLNYGEAALAPAKSGESTPAITPAPAPAPKQETSAVTAPALQDNATSAVSIDEALDKLSQ